MAPTRRFLFNEKTGKIVAFQKGWGKPVRHPSKDHKKLYRKLKGKKGKKGGKKGKKAAKKGKKAKKAGKKGKKAATGAAKPQLKAKSKKEKAASTGGKKAKKGDKKSKKGDKKAGKKGKKSKKGKKGKKEYASLAASFKQVIGLVKDGAFGDAQPVRVFNHSYYADVHDSRSALNGAKRDRFVGLTVSRRHYIVAERLYNNKNKWLIATADGDSIEDASGFINLFQTVNSKASKKVKKAKKAGKKAKKAKQAKKSKQPKAGPGAATGSSKKAKTGKKNATGSKKH